MKKDLHRILRNLNNPRLRRVIERIDDAGCNPRWNGECFGAHCPGHSDDHPSLSVREGKNKPVVVYCHAGCDTETIRKAAGIIGIPSFCGHPV